MPSDDAIRAAQRLTWDGLSTGWEKWDAIIMDQLRPVSDAMLGRLAIAAAQRHLDVASGTGEPGLTVAQIAPEGHVVLSDLSPEMLAIADRRAHALGVTNVETAVCSADDLPFDDASYDSVSVRFGYMFLPDLTAATSEFARVLRPGGRLAASVWIRPDANPWTSLVMQAIGAETALAPSDPDGPGMFRCAEPGAVSALFAEAGLHEVEEWDVAVELVTRTTGEYWDMISEHVSLAVAALALVDDAARDRIRAAVVEQVRRYDDGTAVRVPGLARCIVGTA